MNEKTLYRDDEIAAAIGDDIRRYYLPKHTEHGAIRISVLFDNLRNAIKKQDRTAVELGCKLIVSDPRLPFGKLIKSDVSRALRQNADMISRAYRRAITAKSFELLGLPYTPRELEDYCKLVKKFNADEWRDGLAEVKPISDKSKRLVSYLAGETP